MRKILLIVFLYSLVSGTAFAKVEIWECDVFGKGDTILKIDTSIPKIYIRNMGKWIPYYGEPTTTEYKYSKEHNSISGYMEDGVRIKSFKKGMKEDDESSEVKNVNQDSDNSDKKGTS